MKLLWVCLDGVRIDMALPTAMDDPAFSCPDHPSDPRFSSGGADHTIPREKRADRPLARTLARLATPIVGVSDARIIPVWMTPPTDSGPGWSSLLTGSTHEQCNVWWNEFVGHQLARRPDVLSQIFFADPSARTMVAADWEAIASPAGPGPIIQQRADQQRVGQHGIVDVPIGPEGVPAADREVATRAAWILNHEGPDASVVYLQGPDDAAHTYGAESDEYRSAIWRADEHVRWLVKAVAERHEELGEDWLIVVTTDHGHKPEGGHGEDEVEVRRSFCLLHHMSESPRLKPTPPVLRSHQVCGVVLDQLGVQTGRWVSGHDTGVIRDVSGGGPTRSEAWEW